MLKVQGKENNKSHKGRCHHTLSFACPLCWGHCDSSPKGLTRISHRTCPQQNCGYSFHNCFSLHLHYALTCLGENLGTFCLPSAHPIHQEVSCANSKIRLDSGNQSLWSSFSLVTLMGTSVVFHMAPSLPCYQPASASQSRWRIFKCDLVTSLAHSQCPKTLAAPWLKSQLFITAYRPTYPSVARLEATQRGRGRGSQVTGVKLLWSWTMWVTTVVE